MAGIDGKRVEGPNGSRSVIDDYVLSVLKKGFVGVEENSRMGARICRDRYFEFFSLEVAIVVANVFSLRTGLRACIRVPWHCNAPQFVWC